MRLGLIPFFLQFRISINRYEIYMMNHDDYTIQIYRTYIVFSKNLVLICNIRHNTKNFLRLV